MDFEEQDDHDRDEEMEMVTAAAYHSLAGGGGGGGTVTPHNKLPMPPQPPPLSEEGPTPLSSISNNHRGGGGGVRYRECLKNHAVGLGGHAVDGCGEFLQAGPEGSLDAIKCAACSCHRNFHRREIEGAAAPFLPPPPHHLFQFHPLPPPPPYYRSPAGYLHVRPTLALPSTSDDQEDGSDPMTGMAVAAGGRKRFRTKFTAEQKEKMMSLAERLGWRIQKQDEGLVQDFCSDTGLRRHVLKVWMHNNKHTLGKKP